MNDQLELVVEVYDEWGNFEDQWAYDVSRASIEEWESADQQDNEQGRSLVRFLLLTKLGDYSPITLQLLQNNVCMGDFLTYGVPEDIVREVPRLHIVNMAVDKIYGILSELVIRENIRMVH